MTALSGTAPFSQTSADSALSCSLDMDRSYLHNRFVCWMLKKVMNRELPNSGRRPCTKFELEGCIATGALLLNVFQIWPESRYSNFGYIAAATQAMTTDGS